MKLKTLIIVLSFALLIPTASQSTETAIFPDLKTAKKAFKEQDYTTAAQHWMPLAHNGNTEAQLELGKLYSKGRGVKKDPQIALNLFITAAEKNNERAMFEIGKAYETGAGVKKDTNKAKEWYQLAANNGYARGHYNIGRLYEKNKLNQPANISTDTKTNIRNAVNAINSGHYSQAEYLGTLYQRGIGVPQNNQKALTYFLLAEKSGSTSTRQHAEFLKSKASLEQYMKAESDSDLLLARDDRTVREERKELIRSLKRVKKPSLSPKQIKSQESKALQYYERASQEGYDRASQKVASIQGIEPQLENKKAEQERKKYRIFGELKTQFVGEENLDLGTNNDDLETAFILDSKIGAYLYPTENITTLIEARGVYSEGVATSNNVDDENVSDISFLELRQAWIEFDKLFGLHPLSLKAGRQRFRETRGLWWNRDLDALKLSLNSTLFNGFIAVGENQDQYRLGSDNELDGDDEDRLRILAELSQNYNQNHFIETRFLFEDDHSGTENIGQIVSDNGRDDEDYTLLWAGWRVKGSFENSLPSNLQKIQYRADLMGVTGEETLVNSTANADPNFRTVSSVIERDVLGWAFDGSFDLKLDSFLQPTFTFGYAYGSGDNGRGDNSAFRQTDLDSNTSRFPEGGSSSALRNYGEVLRPELSNLHIANAGINLPVLKASDINLNYFSYWLDNEATGLRSSSINAPLNGQDNYLGQGLDLAAHIKIGQEARISNDALKDTLLRIRLGGFQAGDAFGQEEGDYAYRGSTELRFKF